MDLSTFFQDNHSIVMFIYGLAFFVMGLGIILKNRLHSHISLAKHLKWLALFGIVHGFADWGHLFIPLHEEYASREFVDSLIIFRVFISAISFAFLFQFGISLLVDTINKWHKLAYLPAILFIIWLIQVIVYKGMVNIDGDHLWWIKAGDIFSRYLLAVPGAFLSAYSICLQRKEFYRFNQRQFC